MGKFYTILGVGLVVFCANIQAEDKDAWRSDFGANTSALSAYGEGTTFDVVKDQTLNESVLKVNFDDSSPVEWAHKGVRIDFNPPISWGDFDYITSSYNVAPGASAIGYQLHDVKGSFWHTFETRDVASNTWAISTVPKSMIRFGYNEGDPDKKEAEKDQLIDYMIIYFGTLKVNTRTDYTGLISKIAISKGSPQEAYIDDVTLSKEPPGDGPSTNGDSTKLDPEFDLQWRMNSVNEHGFIMVDGKPFFPLGLYSCMGIDMASATYEIADYKGETTEEVNRARFKAIKDAGFNLLQSYTMNLYGQKVSGPGWKGAERAAFPQENGETTSALYREGMLKFMDYAEEAGLKVLAGAFSSYSINKNLPFNGREEEWKRRKGIIKDNMEALKSHPALLVWYLIDEPSSVPMIPEDMALVYRYMKTLDLDHPIYMAAADKRGDTEYFEDVDIVGPDTYPLAFDRPVMTDINILEEFEKHQKGAMKTPLLWCIVQISQWLEGKVPPTVQEMRLMSLLVLTRDIKGLMFYNHRDYPNLDPKHWQNVTTVIRSLHRVTEQVARSVPVINGHEIDKPSINSLLRKVSDEMGNQHHLLIAANANQDDKLQPLSVGEVEITLKTDLFSKTPEVYAIDENAAGKFEPGKTRKVNVKKTSNGYSFVEIFGPFDARVYEIR